MSFAKAGRSGFLFFSAVLVSAMLLGACGPSTGPNIRGQQRGSTTEIGGVLEEEKFKEIAPVLPPQPQEANLIEFLIRRNSSNHYYIDRESVSLGSDRVVRYTAVIKGGGGAVNTSYEGMHCKSSEFKVFAYGTNAGTWIPTRDPHWERIPRLTPDYRFALFKDYFCDSEAINGRNAKDLIAKLVGNPLNNVTDKNR
jgi:CNP1-like family protein